jgi:FtsP/CotA-like multicopper oxidase with cupredoxin domain
MESEARLTIARTSPEDLKQRQVIIKLDGEWIADLMYDHTMTRAIEPGHHHLRVDNTWNKKNLEFDAAAGEEVKFRVVNRAGRFTWFLVASLGAGPMYVSIERDA